MDGAPARGAPRPPWGAAVGGSAEAAGWVDELEAELALLSGFQVGGLVLDMKKYHDQVCPEDLAGAASALGHPLRLLVLDVDVHLRARRISLDGAAHAGTLAH